MDTPHMTSGRTVAGAAAAGVTATATVVYGAWDRLDNVGRPSAREVHPEWQDLAVGDYLKFWAPGRGPMDAYGVAVLEPNRFLGLYGLSDLRGRRLDPKQPRPSAYMEGLWGFRPPDWAGASGIT